MTNLKRRIGYFALCLGLVSTPVMAEQNISKAAQSEVTNSNDERQIDCLARNIYREAGGESLKGKYAVAHVVMNRAKSGKFGKTPCDVIYQRSRKGCQFSWVCNGNKRPFNQRLLNECREVAKAVYYDRPKDITGGAMYFHARSVNPKWSKRTKVIIGNHVFY